MRIRTVNIEPDVEEVLRAATLDGNNMVLNSQLDPAKYKKVMKVAELIGFKWNKKLKCHTGEGDSVDKLREALEGGKVVDEKKTYQFYETPDEAADKLAQLACIKAGHRVIDPSAGKGALIRAIQRCCPNLGIIYACELNEKMASDLATLSVASCIAGHGAVKVICGDFLLHNEKYDRIVMNPPFCNLQDCEHVKHAYDLLLPGGRLVAIMSKSWKHIDSNRKAINFRLWIEDLVQEGRCSWENLPAGTFSKSGTEIASVIVVIDKDKA